MRDAFTVSNIIVAATERLVVSAVCPVPIVSPPETGYAIQPIAEAS